VDWCGAIASKVTYVARSIPAPCGKGRGTWDYGGLPVAITHSDVFPAATRL
jgi:hypothetical protein